MKKIVMLIIVTTTLVTNMMAEIKPYIGVTSNKFGIDSSNISAKDKTTGENVEIRYTSAVDSGLALGINGGIIIDDNSKVNVSYFSGKDDNSKIYHITVMAMSYDYSLNNYGVRKGWYVGAGMISIKTKILDSPKITSIGATDSSILLKAGFEYLIDKKVLFNMEINTHNAKQDLKYDYKTSENLEGSMTTTISTFTTSINYIF
jgi:outer membrane protein W